MLKKSLTTLESLHKVCSLTFKKNSAMAGASDDSTRELYETPTWAVAVVCAVMIIISLLLEKSLHHIGEWLKKKNKNALVEALAKVKDELMILGFISLLLVFFQNYIIKICIPKKAGDIMLPCSTAGINRMKGSSSKGRRLLWIDVMDFDSNRRSLAAGASTFTCPNGKVPLMSVNGLHELHLFIFFLAVVHIVYSASVMIFGIIKIRSWKEWEKETVSINYEFSTDPSRFRFTRDTSFVQNYASFGNRQVILLYIVSFFRQFMRSISKTDYFTLRHGFINTHLNPGMKFNFQKYIRRSLDDDFKVVVGISPILWACGVIILLLNVHDFQKLFWVTLVPLVLILAVGTKLQAIIATMALEIGQRHAVIQGMPVVKLSDHHFWFGRPRLLLFLIHFTLFVNAFQLTYFLWIWYKFGLDSCFHDGFGYVIARVCIGVVVHFLCSYITLPLYALVSQMGSHIKMSIFDERASKALKKWRDGAKKNTKDRSSHSPSPSVSVSPSPAQSPLTSPRSRYMYQNKSTGYTGEGFRKSHSDTAFSDVQIEIPVARSALSQHNDVQLNIHDESQRRDPDDFSFVKFHSRDGQ